MDLYVSEFVYVSYNSLNMRSYWKLGIPIQFLKFFEDMLSHSVKKAERCLGLKEWVNQ